MIAFPPVTRWRDGIADVFVRRFAQAHENVRTFCLAGAPPDDAPTAIGTSQWTRRGAPTA